MVCSICGSHGHNKRTCASKLASIIMKAFARNVGEEVFCAMVDSAFPGGGVAIHCALSAYRMYELTHRRGGRISASELVEAIMFEG